MVSEIGIIRQFQLQGRVVIILFRFFRKDNILKTPRLILSISFLFTAGQGSSDGAINVCKLIDCDPVPGKLFNMGNYRFV
jgi:hypothetical protein